MPTFYRAAQKTFSRLTFRQHLHLYHGHLPISAISRHTCRVEPSPLAVMEAQTSFLELTMRNPAARTTAVESDHRAILTVLLSLGLSVLIGCAGVSTGKSNQQASAGTLGSNPASLNFGSVTLGKTQTLSASITNSGGTSLTISQVGISGAGFTMSSVTSPLTLLAGQSTAFSINFAPSSAGTVSGSVTITSNASDASLSIPLSGSGTTTIGQLGASPATLNVGSVVVGTSGSASGSLSATGANVTVTAASTTNSAFSLGGISLPVTIAAGQSLPYSITFSPKATGAVSATFTVTSDAALATTTEGLTGTGTAAPTHTVSLSWDATTSPGILGYNIYRAVYTTSCGSYGKINAVLNTSTAYSDSTVSDGVSYCYAATAVNTSNEESGYSNIVSDLQIPLG